MNRKQWFGSAVVFYLIASLTGGMSVTFGTDFQYGNVWLASRIYAALTWFMYSFAGVCLVCGTFEGEGKKK